MALHKTTCCYRSKIAVGACFLWHAPILLFNFSQELFHRNFKMIQLTPVNKVAEVEGIEAIYRGAKLVVARANNTKFKRIFKQLLKPYKHQIDKGSLDDETSEDLMVSAYAEAILVGWKDLTDVNGKSWPYNKNNARDLLKSDPDCFDFVKETSEDMDRFITREEKETKNELEA